MSKIGRNDPCPCGSGRKYKHCHGAEGADARSSAAPPADAAQLLQTGLQYHRAGRLAEAETLYRRILEREPGHAEATHFLGMIAHQGGKNAEAAELIARAIERAGTHATPYMHNNLAEALSALQRNDDAIANYRKAIALDAGYADAYNNLGVALTRAGNFDEAETALKRAIAIDRGAINPRTNLGNLYQEMQRFDDAIAEYREALAIDAGDAETHNNLGNALRASGRIEEAISSYRRSISLMPGYAQALNNLAVALQVQGNLAETFRCFDIALQADPGNPNTISNRAFAYLAAGRLAEGWRDYESRFFRSANRADYRALGQPQWHGERLAGQRLRVWGEQGVGDEIWAAGMFDDLIGGSMGPAQIVIECRPKLTGLFSRSFPEAKVAPLTDPPNDRCLEGIDLQIGGGSLAQFLRPSLERFPKRERTGGAYLLPDKTREAYWRQRVAAIGAGRKIGICWRSTDLKGDRALACTRLSQWGAVLSVPGVNFINLQYDDCEDELNSVESSLGVKIARFRDVDMFNDLDETAALIRAMDLVISAPTAVSLLAAALGVPTWQMHYGNYWQNHGTWHNPWFPSMHVYHRKWNESWEQVIRRLARALMNTHTAVAGLAQN